jgi:hypothetical protein
MFVGWFTLARGYLKGIEQQAESGEALCVIMLTVRGLLSLSSLYCKRVYAHVSGLS